MRDYQVIWYGLCDDTGYGQVTINSVLQLHKKGIDVKLVPIDGIIRTQSDNEILKSLISNNINTSKKQIAVYHIQPNSYPTTLETMYDKQIGFTVWETDKIPVEWVEICNKMDAMIVPSRINKEVFEDCGVTVPLHIARHGINESVFNSNGEVFDFGCDMPKFKFLSVGTFQFRKGLELLLKAYWQEFNSNDDVGLIIKTSKINNVKQVFEQFRNELGIGDFAPIYVSGENFTDEQMASIYRACDCFVLPSRGEGVGLPYMEAGACGLPVIASNWGGQVDFLNDKNSYLVDGNMEHVDEIRANFPFFKSYMKWFNPDMNHLQHLMRDLYENREEIKRGANALHNELHTNWQWSNTVNDLITIFDSVVRS